LVDLCNQSLTFVINLETWGGEKREQGINLLYVKLACEEYNVIMVLLENHN